MHNIQALNGNTESNITNAVFAALRQGVPLEKKTVTIRNINFRVEFNVLGYNSKNVEEAQATVFDAVGLLAGAAVVDAFDMP